MVCCRLVGQLGNQLFQIAATIATALRNNTNYLIPRVSASKKNWPCYIQHLPEYKGEPISCTYEEPKDFSFQPIPFTDNMCLSGYFQCEDHFKDYRKEIIEALAIPYHKAEGFVSIHVRRGDYLTYPTKHPAITKDYIVEAMHYFIGYKFMMFSDDPDWCLTEFGDYHSICFVKDTPMEDLRIMSCCEHNIIANSTFSWWGAYLNQNPDKKVIAPKIWFGADNSHLTDKHIIPPEWIRI